MVIVVIGWVLFNRNGIGQLGQTLDVMFSAVPTRWLDALRANTELLYSTVWLPASVLTVAFERSHDAKPEVKSASACADLDGTSTGGKRNSKGTFRDFISMVWCLIILLLCLMQLLNSSYNPFIYFRF